MLVIENFLVVLFRRFGRPLALGKELFNVLIYLELNPYFCSIFVQFYYFLLFIARVFLGTVLAVLGALWRRRC